MGLSTQTTWCAAKLNCEQDTPAGRPGALQSAGKLSIDVLLAEKRGVRARGEKDWNCTGKW